MTITGKAESFRVGNETYRGELIPHEDRDRRMENAPFKMLLPNLDSFVPVV